MDYTDASSTGTKMPRTSWSDMARYDVALPDEQTASQYDALVSNLMSAILSNIHESRALAAQRDALLPRLVSGEVRV